MLCAVGRRGGSNLWAYVNTSPAAMRSGTRCSFLRCSKHCNLNHDIMVPPVELIGCVCVCVYPPKHTHIHTLYHRSWRYRPRCDSTSRMKPFMTSVASIRSAILWSSCGGSCIRASVTA